VKRFAGADRKGAELSALYFCGESRVLLIDCGLSIIYSPVLLGRGNLTILGLNKNG
jgi:hypothetical protein